MSIFRQPRCDIWWEFEDMGANGTRWQCAIRCERKRGHADPHRFIETRYQHWDGLTEGIPKWWRTPGEEEAEADLEKHIRQQPWGRHYRRQQPTAIRKGVTS